MSLEQKIEALTAAVEALTVAMKAGGAAPAASASADKPAGTKTTKTTKAAEYEPKHSKEEMQAAMAEVKEKLGVAKAKEIRGEVGKVDKLADITDPKIIDAVYDAAQAALAAGEDDDV